MSIVSFGGKPGFWARVHMPKLSSWLYLTTQEILRRKHTLRYIAHALELKEKLTPMFVNIETMNRCNGKCSFCPANINAEQRPLKKMDTLLLDKILHELSSINYTGVLSLHVNNEPFMDHRMPEMLRMARGILPNACIMVFTNGTLLTEKKLTQISNCVNIMYVNNYNDTYNLTDSSKKIYDYVTQHPAEFQNMDIVIQRRYTKECLANRAGTAPNKPATQKIIKSPCIIPLTDFTIFPDGKVGLCCNDTLEKTNMGNVTTQSILEIFHSQEMRKVHEMVGRDRSSIPFCKHCDVIDSGIRLKFAEKNRQATIT